MEKWLKHTSNINNNKQNLCIRMSIRTTATQPCASFLFPYYSISKRFPLLLLLLILLLRLTQSVNLSWSCLLHFLLKLWRQQQGCSKSWAQCRNEQETWPKKVHKDKQTRKKEGRKEGRDINITTEDCKYLNSLSKDIFTIWRKKLSKIKNQK